MTKTNDQLYDKLIDIEQHVIKTNGRVTVNKWIGSSALAISTFLAGVLIVGKVW